MAGIDEPGSWRTRTTDDEFGWMLVPSLIVGWLGISVYIAWFAALHLSAVLSATTGRIGLLAAASASLVFGAKTSRLLLGSHTEQRSRLTPCLVVLVISGTVFLLLLDAIAFYRM